jgi:hypothetical protein
MAKNLYVRVKPKGPVSEFHRCGIKFGLLWVLLINLDDATAERLETEQMLETSLEKPEGFDDQANREENNSGETDAGALYGSGVLPSVIAFAGGFEIALGELVQQAHTESELSVADWNGLPEPARELILGGKLHALYVEYKEANGLQGGVHVVADLKEQLAALTTERDGLLKKVTDFETSVGTLQGEVTKLESELKKVNGELIEAKAGAKTAEPAAKTTAKTKAK